MGLTYCMDHGSIIPCLICKREKNAAEKLKPKQPKIRFRSKKETKRMEQYNLKRKEYQKQNPKCESKGFSDQCSGVGSEIHHFFQYREGDALTDVSQFRNCCTPCHQKIHSHVAEAVEGGFMASKEEKAKYIQTISKNKTK